MDPLLDEKLVLTTSRSVVEYLEEQLQVQAWREAYGPSLNEGICFESATSVAFDGDFSGSIFYCMDGYTRLKLLPIVAEKFRLDFAGAGMATSILQELANQISFRILAEFEDAGYQLRMDPPEDWSHRVYGVDAARKRQYVVIFFLEDRARKQYLGRWHAILLLDKFRA